MKTIALVGSPNCGKTTLFNALTGSRQKTGNYPGVTVEKKEGLIHKNLSVLDLPGIYSLEPKTTDEEITCSIIKNQNPHQIAPNFYIAVADLTNLERNLYLILQLKEQKIPFIVALTMSDLAQKNELEISKEKLSQELNAPVVIVSGLKKTGIKKLLETIDSFHPMITQKTELESISQTNNTSEVILQRYIKIEKILKICTQTNTKNLRIKELTKKIDAIVLHRIFGPLLMVILFTLMFQMVFSIAHIPMDYIETGVSILQNLVRKTLPDGDLQSLLSDGIIGGVGAVFMFLPQILLLYAFILFFEDSGYMTRSAFILDRMMNKVGLHGRAFIPLLSSFACAIPGIMATRTIENRRDRIITILVSPLMTCSARIPIYTLLIAAFVPSRKVFGFFSLQALTMAGLYLFGIVTALLLAFIFKKTLFRGKKSSFVLELPTYRVPSFKNIGLGLLDRSKIFVRKAGTVILALSILLWILATFPRVDQRQLNEQGIFDSNQIAAIQLENSFAGRLGHFIEPSIAPLGFDWKIGIGLLSSFAAREVVLSTLGTVYSIEYKDDNATALTDKLKANGKFGLPNALSLLIFYALACQCMSTIAIVRRETNSWRWPAFMFLYMSGLAYIAAFFTFQISRHLLQL